MKLNAIDIANIHGPVQLLKRCEQGSDEWKAAALAVMEALGPLRLTRSGDLRKAKQFKVKPGTRVNKQKNRGQKKMPSRDNLPQAQNDNKPARVQKKHKYSKNKPAKTSQ